MSVATRCPNTLAHPGAEGRETLASPGSMDETGQTLRTLRSQVRSLEKQRARIRRASQVVHSPTLLLRLRTVLVFCLCGSSEWALLWASRFQRRQRGLYSEWQQPLSRSMIEGWVRELQHESSVQAALQNLGHPWRMAADEFLVESLLYEDVLAANGRGLELPSPELMQGYLRKWRFRPCAPSMADLLNRLDADRDRGRKWSQRFRQRWGLSWGRLTEVRSLSRSMIRHRGGIYLRWIKWVLQQPSPSAPTIVVAMDETALASLTKRGMAGAVVARHRQGALRQAPSVARRQLGRTALMASVCSDADLQQHLPQVWLPRTPANGRTSSTTRAVFSEAGHPHEAWHGSQGFCTQRIVVAWLRRVHRVVKRHRQGARLVIVMDVCPVHVVPAVLATARRLHVDVVLVPARLTWLLQILDTHVFAQLKREMRKMIGVARLRSEGPELPIPEHLRMLTQAASKMLVGRSWQHLFPGVGLNGCTDALRPGLRHLMEDQDLSPRKPTVEELAEVLGAHRKNVNCLHRLLFPTNTPSAGSAAVSAPPDSISLAADDEAADPVLAPWQPARATSMTTAGTQNAPAQSPAQPCRLPRGRRLLPCVRNMQILPPPPVHPEGRVATRSQRPSLVRGVVGAPKRRRTLPSHGDSQT